MSYEVILLSAAERELWEIQSWLAERSPQGAAQWFNRFTDALRALERNPLSFGIAPENDYVNREVRQILFKTKSGRRYRALFTISGDTVFVLHIRAPGQPLLESNDF